MTVPLGLQGIGTIDALDGVGEGKAGEVQLCVAGIQPGERQKILDDVGHPVGLRDDNVQEVVFRLLRNGPSGVPQGLRIAADIGEGGTQFMGDIGHEFLAPLFIAVLLRHVVENDQHTAAGLV